MKKVILFAALAVTVMSSCFKSDTQTENSSQSDTGIIKKITVPFSTSGKYKLFRLVDSSYVLNSDSATSSWDFGMRRATLIFNSASSGPGQGAVILENATFASVTRAPYDGYAFDTTASQKAIKDYSWYTYNPQTRGFDPIAGKTFVIKTGEGRHYAKVQFIKAEYEPFVGPMPVNIIYTFRYYYQADGSVNFF